MKALLIAAIALTMPETAIAARTLNPLPTPSEPCRTVSTPHGDMCAPKLTQSILKVYGEAIRTQRETDAKLICHGRGGNEVIATDRAKEWLCVRRF